MRVSTSCSGRFHIFDQAFQLQRLGYLEQLVCDYPKILTRNWGLDDKFVNSLLLNGVFGRSIRLIKRVVNEKYLDGLDRRHHDYFSKKLAKNINKESDVFIGLSSFCYEAILQANKNSSISIVDHGSLHQRFDRDIMLEEYDIWGSEHQNLTQQWVIDKEDEEFKEADYVFALSEIAKRSMIECGVKKEKIRVNNCGVNLRNFKKIKKNDTTFRIIFCGSFTLRKGPQYLLKAFMELSLPNSELVLLGGDPENSEITKILKRFKSNSIKYIKPVNQKELYKIYSNCSIMVLPSIADGFGMVVPQAMACGLPVIVTENVGAADIVNESITGNIGPIRDVDFIKKKILELYEDNDLHNYMSMNALQAVTNLTWDQYGDRLKDILDELS